MATAKAQDAALGKPLETAKPEVKQKRKGPDSLLYRALVWLLLNGQIFSPNRDLITEGAYMRMRGGKKWPWVANTSFAFMHDHTEEDIRGLYNEPLGKIGVIVAWLLLLAGAGLTAWGVTRGIYTQAAFAALAVAPILYAMLRVSRARFRAKCEMVRRAYENERCGRQDPRFTRLDEEDRTAIVAHHIVLAYLEEVLETCIYGERTLLVDSSAAMDRIAAGHTASLHRHGNNNNNNEREGPANPVALDAGPDRGTAAELAPAQSLMSAARGLRGSTGRGGMDTMGSDDPWCCCQMPPTTFSVSRRLRNIPRFCDQAVDAILYKYGWHSDSDLRQAAVVKAETKLRLSSRVGHHWRFSVLMTALCNAIFIGAAVAVAVATGTWHAYVPLIGAAGLIFAASMLLLQGKLPTWRVVDGMTSRSRARVDAGTVQDEVTAATDVATRALEMSLRTFDDRGELQSCSYWHQMVPAGRHSGLLVAVSGGLYGKGIGSETRSLYGNVSGPMSGLSGISGTQLSPQNSWRTLPDPEYCGLNTKLSLQSMDGKYPHVKPGTPPDRNSRSTRPDGLTSTSAGASTSSSNARSPVGQEPTMMGQEPTCMESLAAAEVRSVHGDASIVSPTPTLFGPSQASKSSSSSGKRGRVGRTGSGSSSSPAYMARTDSSFAFLPEHHRVLLHKDIGAPRSTSRSTTAVSTSTERTVSTPLQPGQSGLHASAEHSPEFQDTEASSPHYRGLTPAHPSFAHMLGAPSPSIHDTHALNESASPHTLNKSSRFDDAVEIEHEGGSEDNEGGSDGGSEGGSEDDSTVLGPGPKDVRVDDVSFSGTQHGSSCLHTVSQCGTAKSHPRNDGSSFFNRSSFMEGSVEGRDSTHLPPLPGVALFDARHLVSAGTVTAPSAPAAAAPEQSQQGPGSHNSALPPLHGDRTAKDVSKLPSPGLRGASRHVVRRQLSKERPNSVPLESAQLNSSTHAHNAFVSPAEAPASIEDSQNNGLQHSSLRGATFLDLLNAHPDGPVGQDVVNDALAVVRNLPPPVPRSQADTLRSGSGPASYSPGLLDSRYSTYGSNNLESIDKSPEHVNTSTAELPANTQRMNERHVFNAECKLIFDNINESGLAANSEKLNPRHVFNAERKMMFEKMFSSR